VYGTVRECKGEKKNMNKLSASILMLLLCLSFATIFTIKLAYATTNTIFTTPAQVYSAFDSLPNSSGTLWKQEVGLSDNGNVIYAYWFRNATVACDLNHDGIVNVQDTAIVANAFGSSINSTYWNPIADINYDGIVNMKDIALVAHNFKRTNLPSQLIMLDGSIHGDEYQTATLLYNLAQFLTNSSSNRANNITNSVQILIIPIVNIDNFNVKRQDINNVNINRNFLYNWGARATWSGSNGQGSTNPNDTTGNYIGPSAESENETRFLQTFFNLAHVGVYNNFHGGGAAINGENNPNPQGRYMTNTCFGETSQNIANGNNVYSNYTAVSNTYGITNEYNRTGTTSENIDGCAGCEALNVSLIPSVTIEVWNSTWQTQQVFADQLNSSNLDEIKCLVEGEKNYLTGQSAYEEQGIRHMTEASVCVDPSTDYETVNIPFNMTVDIENVQNLGAWYSEITWSRSFNCTNAYLSDPSSWNGSVEVFNNITYSTLIFNGCRAMIGSSGSQFNGTTTVITLTFVSSVAGKGYKVSFNDAELSDTYGNAIPCTTSYATITISR
jgi:hypothetical protein